MSDFSARIREIDPDRFLAGLFVPSEKREAYFLLCAFNHELARAREVASLGMLALIRLQWWREVVEGTKRRHEIAEPLSEALEAGGLDQASLLSMIDAREAEADDAIPDLASLQTYLEGSAGGFAVAAGRLLGAGDADLGRLRRLGAVYGLAGLLLNVTALARQERCLLPQDILAAHALSVHDVIHDPRAAAPVVAELSALGLRWFSDASGRMPRAVIAAGLPAILAARDLRRGVYRRLFGDRAALTIAGLAGRL